MALIVKNLLFKLVVPGTVAIYVPLLILGWAVLFWDSLLLLYALGVGSCFQLFIVLYEEPHLAKTFGTAYDDYRARVRRWLPGLRRGKHPGR